MIGGKPAEGQVERKTASTAIPCTCGELFQGSLDGEPCLVSCPIDRFSSACLRDSQAEPGSKVRRALRLLPNEGKWVDTMDVHSPLSAGRGYGTSTADIGAALFFADHDLTPEQAARIAVQVEPTDSTLFPGLTLFAHRTGTFSRFIGLVPHVALLVVDPGGFVDTQRFNAQDWQPQLNKLAAEHCAAFDLLQKGIQQMDMQAIGRAASLSARLHQTILHNPLLDKVMSIAGDIHALGVCRAHSGTILGIMVDPRRDDRASLLAFCKERLPADAALFFASMVDGGPRFNKEGLHMPEGAAV